MSETFSLLNEPWIQCRTVSNETVLVGIRQVFDGSCAIREIRGDSPTQDFAVLRVLLAIFWRAHGSAVDFGRDPDFEFEEWFIDAFEAAATNSTDDVVLTYLENYVHRFDLLSPTEPFMQVADLHTNSGRHDTIRRIVPEAEGDFFTMRSGAGTQSLSFAEAARWLIHTQAYDYSGIKSGAVGDLRVKSGRGYPIGPGWSGMIGGTIVHGTNLRQTLVLNTVREAITATRGRDDDHPVWEREPDTATQRELPTAKGITPHGPADLATWQSRRMRLFTEGDRVTGVLVSNGDQIPEAGANVMADPMTPYRFSKNKSKTNYDVYYPRRHESPQTAWRALEPLICLAGDTELPRKEKSSKRPTTLTSLAHLRHSNPELPALVDIQLVSVSYGSQAAVITGTANATLEIYLDILNESETQTRIQVLDAVRDTQEACIALGAFAGQLKVAAGGDYEFDATVKDQCLLDLENSFISWIATVTPANASEMIGHWQKHVFGVVMDTARTLLRGVGTRALIGTEVEGSGHNARKRFVCAGTLIDALERKLHGILPHAHQKTTPEGGKDE